MPPLSKQKKIKKQSHIINGQYDVKEKYKNNHKLMLINNNNTKKHHKKNNYNEIADDWGNDDDSAWESWNDPENVEDEIKEFDLV
ncbi:unnamed protein product [Rhizophagus irregularis]|nr:unnamed protein product [Rhizophagus irregularis]